MTTATNTLLALLLAALLSTSYLLDGPTDHHAEWAQADNLRAAIRQAEHAQRREQAAAAICRQQHGEADYAWSATGQLICQPRRGRAVLTKVQLPPQVQP